MVPRTLQTRSAKVRNGSRPRSAQAAAREEGGRGGAGGRLARRPIGAGGGRGPPQEAGSFEQRGAVGHQQKHGGPCRVHLGVKGVGHHGLRRGAKGDSEAPQFLLLTSLVRRGERERAQTDVSYALEGHL